MTWAKDQQVVVGSTRYYTHEATEHWRGAVEKLRPGGGCVAWGRNWRANGMEAGGRTASLGDPELFDAAKWDALAAEYKQRADEHAARLADAKRRGAAKERIALALDSATPEQCEALASEIEARAPTFGTLSPLSWDVRIDGDRQAIEPLDASRAREDFGNWRAHLAVVHHAECADADKHGEPRPKPPTLELVVEVVVDRWEP